MFNRAYTQKLIYCTFVGKCFRDLPYENGRNYTGIRSTCFMYMKGIWRKPQCERGDDVARGGGGGYSHIWAI